MDRILLKKGKQKELIEKAKENLSWKDLARELKCNSLYLCNELRNEKRTISKEIYDKLVNISKKNFDKYIIKELKENWGQIKGGNLVKNRKNLFQVKKPKIISKKSEELAEIIGILIGDGNIHTILSKGIYQVRISGNPHMKEEVNYLTKYTKNLLEKKFDLKMGVNKNKSLIYKQSKDLVFTLNNFGLPSGNKLKNNISIPSWIIENKTYLKHCIRGIIDTDGYVYPKSKNHKFLTIQISSAIPNLQKSITKAFKILDIKLSKWRDKNRTGEAYISTKEDNYKYLKEISFKNQKHLKKWKKYAPVV